MYQTFRFDSPLLFEQSKANSGLFYKNPMPTIVVAISFRQIGPVAANPFPSTLAKALLFAMQFSLHAPPLLMATCPHARPSPLAQDQSLPSIGPEGAARPRAEVKAVKARTPGTSRAPRAPLPIQHSSLPSDRLRNHIRNNHRGTVIEANTNKVVNGAPKFSSRETLEPCGTCVNAKSTHKPVPHQRENKRARNPARRLVYTDWWGPYAHPGIAGETYIQAFIDDASGIVCCFSSPNKDCSAANLRAYVTMIAELTDGACTVAVVQGDSEKLFTHGDFAADCACLGIHQRFSGAYSHQQNGKVERFWRTMETSVTAMMDYSGTPLYLWPYAVQTFVNHYNRQSNSAGDLTPIEQLTGHRPDISTFRVWGCPASAFLEKSDHLKFTSKCIEVINLGPDPKTKDGFYAYIPQRRTVRTTRHISFDEMWRARAEHYKMLNTHFPTITSGFERPLPPSPPDAPPAVQPPPDSDSDDDDDTPYVIAPAPPVVNTPPTSPQAPL